MDIHADSRVADLAAAHPATIAVFERHGIDFCCGGQRPLGQACQASGAAFDAVAGELRQALAGPRPDDRDWTEAPLGDLVDHIVSRYHARLNEDLPRLDRMMNRVLEVHGPRHPERLPALAETFRGLHAELAPHMTKEERILFPFIAQLAAARPGHAPFAPFGSVAHPIRMMESEHESAGAALVRMREISEGYAPPEGACNTFRGLLYGLSELERELHEHIHLENNVLHPRSLALERSLSAVGV